MYTRAIVGFDGAERAFDALSLAESLISRDGELIACYVRPRHVGDRSHTPSEDRCGETVLERARERLNGRVQLRCQTLWARSTTTALQAAAGRERADLIVLGSSHRGRLGRVLAGSVTEGVLHGASCAVAVAPVGMHRALRGGIAAIAVGVDGGPASIHATSFAGALAAELDAKLRLVAVADLTSGIAVSSASGLAYGSIAEARRAQAREALDRALDMLPSALEIIPEAYEGEPAERLLALSGGVDLMVLESRGRGPLRRLVLGSVCGRVVRGARCPVLALPASGRHQFADDGDALSLGRC